MSQQPYQQTRVSDSNQQALLHAASLISSAERLLTQAISRTTDPAIASVLNREYARLDALLSRLLYAQGCTDEELKSTLPALKQQAATLHPSDSSIMATAPDVVTASTIVGYVTRAVNLIGSL